VIAYERMPTQEWNGASYDRVSGVQEAMGRPVLARLPLSGEETVIDAGCGSGRITEALLARLPRGRVIAVDGSGSMAQAAARRLAADAGPGGRVEIRVLDLLELEVSEPVDAVLSTATFHWVADHPALFARVHAALRPGGRLVAQCGGEGNIAVLRGEVAALLAREPYAEHFEDWRAPWNYAAPEPTRERLLAAGFASADCWLSPAPSTPEHPHEFLATIVLGPHVAQLPQELRERFIDEVLELLGEPVTIDYVRLNIDAVA
jgi:trans-aconitate 2-methyltransferase